MRVVLLLPRMGHFGTQPRWPRWRYYSHGLGSICESLCCEYGELFYYSSGDESDCQRVSTCMDLGYMPDLDLFRLNGGHCYFC
ncbi:hypothetical protein LINGRAHAP2_LOCUS5843 [Linum grandiflorum]